MPLVARYANLF